MQQPQAECFDHLEQRRAIMATLIELLAEKPLDQIKTADLCSRCGISRASFYRCFSGVRDIGSWYQRYTSELGLHQIGLTLSCIEGHRVSLELIAQARSLYRAYPNQWNTDFSLSSVNGQVESMRVALEAHGIAVDSRMRYLLEGVSYSSHHTVGNWISRNLDIPVADLVEIIVSFYPSDLRRILDDPVQPMETAALLENLVLSMRRGR